jgi:ATP-dependent DNA ligase
LGAALSAHHRGGDGAAVRSCLIDGEAVCCDDNGVAVFAKLRGRRNDRHVILRAFDLLELDGKDLLGRAPE